MLGFEVTIATGDRCTAPKLSLGRAFMGYASRARLNEPPPALQEKKRQRAGFAALRFHRQSISASNRTALCHRRRAVFTRMHE
jgi:hypothetical protein